MKFELKKYNNSYKTDWNSFISTSKNGLFFFDRDFMEYHSDRFTDHSLLIFNDQQIVAVFPANESGEEIISHGGLTFGSLIMSHYLKAKEVLVILDEIKKYFTELSFKKITYKAIPHIFHKYPAEEDLYALFRIEAKLFRRDISSVIDLSHPIRFSETKRQLVRKCEQKGISVSESENFTEYWTLLSEVLQKFGTKPVHTVEEITLLKEKFPQNIQLFEAKKDGIIFAGIVIFNFDNVIHTQYMAASQEGRKVGALDFINYTLLNKFSNKKYYSFGISTEQQGKFLNEGLIQQKENMGARGIALDFYSIKL
ncbi:GNAT family N-acetyltransferase [Chryseobacterium lactis]|uniref:GNAT family N-acetyltransferase n=1 Tax=Chryseobacterium lactis TaxID=1241981 RepID=A0A3G6RR02_CHRLC|nr:GNAT family N-acetyltransferase [Chryseobacterium lactis]AZA81730.1 GNAT family N-acetyltransferase [Chryseobacterium lactis]AZB06728.1 GNAT family N-acetyltransferase [Chryseobacterium lactis]PNW15579.1 GNAT family N-acetyltransferase [Chryseobacterium lactis]